MSIRITVYLLALLFVAMPSRPRATGSVVQAPAPALRVEQETPGFPVARAALALVLITGLGLEVVSRRSSR